MALVDATLAALDAAADGDLVFANYVDFDTLYGHPRDVAGYARALEAFDARLPEIFARLRPGDLVVITADHGNDPTWRGTDHTRERVPVLATGPGLAPARRRPRRLRRRRRDARGPPRPGTRDATAGASCDRLAGAARRSSSTCTSRAPRRPSSSGRSPPRRASTLPGVFDARRRLRLDRLRRLPAHLRGRLRGAARRRRTTRRLTGGGARKVRRRRRRLHRDLPRARPLRRRRSRRLARLPRRDPRGRRARPRADRGALHPGRHPPLRPRARRGRGPRVAAAPVGPSSPASGMAGEERARPSGRLRPRLRDRRPRPASA